MRRKHRRYLAGMGSDFLTDVLVLIGDALRMPARIATILKELHDMGLTLEDVLTETQKQTTLIGSLKTFVQGLKDQLAAAGTDPVKLQAVMDALTANDAVISAISTGPSGTPVTTP